MRYIILFIIAILLPIFAFLNFTQEKEDGYRTKSKASFGEKTASVAAIIIDEANDPQKLTDDDKDKTSYKIPDIRYTTPVNFPQTTAVSQPYLENFKSPNFFPIRKWDIRVENTNASSALVIEPITQKALYHKNLYNARPIASLTKLMTAIIVIDEMNLNSEINISDAAIASYGDQGGLRVNEVLTVENLLYILLIESSNDAAIAIEEYYNAFRAEQDKTFVAAMNKKAQELGLLDTFFVEPSGLNVNNRSTAYDLARLADYVFQRPILRQIMSIQVIDIQSVDGLTNHHLVNSNTLLGALPGVLAGKTGYTEEAGESLILFVKKSKNIDDYLIYVILGSDDRIKAARHLIDWVDRAYIWE